MDERMEKLMKKQLAWQRITAILLVVLIVCLVLAGLYAASVIEEMTLMLNETMGAMNDALHKVAQLDIEGINQSFAEVEDLMESLQGVTEQFESISEAIANFRNKLRF